MRFSLVLATLAMSTVAFAQDGNFQIGYAANLNIGDSVVNLSNDGFGGGIFSNATQNLCVNTYVFDPQEEEIGCCYCVVTPNGLNSLSVVNDLISNNLTPAVPTSVVIKLVATVPSDYATNVPGSKCNPGSSAAAFTTAATGMLAWGTTLEPASTPGTYAPVAVAYHNGTLSTTEASGLRSLCNFIQANGTGYGICKSCRLGALGGAKQ